MYSPWCHRSSVMYVTKRFSIKFFDLFCMCSLLVKHAVPMNVTLVS